jgi:DNA repair protein RadC
MTADAGAPVLRIRELELRYRTRRLDWPFKGSLGDPRHVMLLAEDMLRDTITDAVLVLHLTKRLRLLGVHRLTTLSNAESVVAEILRAALLSGAAVLIYVHRRVSDDWAGEDDSVLVGKLRQAARMFDIELREAVIIWSTPDELIFYSFRNDYAL